MFCVLMGEGGSFRFGWEEEDAFLDDGCLFHVEIYDEGLWSLECKYNLGTVEAEDTEDSHIALKGMRYRQHLVLAAAYVVCET